jgi:hypothetical protein
MTFTLLVIDFSRGVSTLDAAVVAPIPNLLFTRGGDLPSVVAAVLLCFVSPGLVFKLEVTPVLVAVLVVVFFSSTPCLLATPLAEAKPVVLYLVIPAVFKPGLAVASSFLAPKAYLRLEVGLFGFSSVFFSSSSLVVTFLYRPAALFNPEVAV